MIQTMKEKITPEQFVYWLQGYLELENPKTMTAKQTKILKDHLKLVFNKVTPSYITTTNDQEIKYCTKLENLPGTWDNNTTFIC